MKPLVAVTGKGGTGKSTISALLVQQMVKSGVTPVLAVDADPNYCLGELLGMEVTGTMADLREETRAQGADMGGMSPATKIDLGLNEIIAEGEGFDLLTMGRPEGQGCYCYINALLKDWIKKASRNYAMVIIDNEAGMEHVSRLLTTDVDTLLVVAEPTVPAAKAVQRIMELSRGLPMQIGRRVVLWNRSETTDVPEFLARAADLESADAVMAFPADKSLAEAYSKGEKLDISDLELPALAALGDACRPQGVSNTSSTSSNP